ncbi:MAG: aldo/keto reductase [Oscillospiraceae bacterium]|nr:aldo/keto reductase [Oscillospiraceae bacterium]
MNMIDIGKSGLIASEIIFGSMRLGALTTEQAVEVISVAYENGVNFFDHADIYGGDGGSEIRFTEALKLTDIKREDIILQSKCGIRSHPSGNHNYYDFSYEHIVSSVDKILKRLNTDYLDILLLHRPDTLMEPDEVAKAFDELEANGKVRHFGVSNQHPMHIELLKKSVKQRLLVNQLQFSPVFTGMINCGIEVNIKTDSAANRDGLILEYSRINNMTIQAWSPYQYGTFEGVFLLNDDFSELNTVIRRIATENNVDDVAVVAAWILRHPAKIQVVMGSMNKARIEAICKASELSLSREEWYEIYVAAGNLIP